MDFVEGDVMMLIDALDERRRLVRDNSNSTFVQRDEFCSLLLSTRRLVRSDEPGRGVRGLLDMDTGVRFLIEQEKLFAK
jgi:hypothetical protein